MNKILSLLHRLAVPSERNNFRAKGLHIDFLTGMIAIALLMAFFVNQQKTAILGYATDITIEKLFEKTNEQRTSRGLSALRYNGLLARAAQNKAQDMLSNNYWAHYRPSDGKAPWSFITESGYKYEYAGENLAQGFMFSDGVVQAWMQSPTHAANIVRPEYNEVGFAVMNGILNGEEITLVVQMFGKELSQANPIVRTAQAEEINEKLKPAAKLSPPPLSPSPTQEKNDLAEKTIQNYYSGNIATNQTRPAQNVIFNIDKVSFSSTLVILLILTLIIVIDFIVARRLNIIRISGKNIAHFLFLVIVIVGVLIITKGLII